MGRGRPKGSTKRDCFSNEDTARIMQLRDERGLSWPDIAKQFPEKTQVQIRNRYHTRLAYEKHKESGVLSPSSFHEHRDPGAEAEALRQRACVPEYATLTASFFGDPRPGRSALDKRRAGIVDRVDNHGRSNPASPLWLKQPEAMT